MAKHNLVLFLISTLVCMFLQLYLAEAASPSIFQGVQIDNTGNLIPYKNMLVLVSYLRVPSYFLTGKTKEKWISNLIPTIWIEMQNRQTPLLLILLQSWSRFHGFCSSKINRNHLMCNAIVRLNVFIYKSSTICKWNCFSIFFFCCFFISNTYLLGAGGQQHRKS